MRARFDSDDATAASAPTTVVAKSRKRVGVGPAAQQAPELRPVVFDDADTVQHDVPDQPVPVAARHPILDDRGGQSAPITHAHRVFLRPPPKRQVSFSRRRHARRFVSR